MARPGMTRNTATLIGFAAILMWSLLSLLTVASGTMPPFQLAAMTFAISGGMGAATWLFRPGAAAALKQPPEVWALGVGGLFGYHALFFFARSEEHTSELQSRLHLVCRLLLDKNKADADALHHQFHGCPRDTRVHRLGEIFVLPAVIAGHPARCAVDEFGQVAVAEIAHEPAR